MGENFPASNLSGAIAEAWENLAKAVFNPELIKASLAEIVKNPLVISVTSALLVVAGFAIFARAISIFNIKH